MTWMYHLRVRATKPGMPPGLGAPDSLSLSLSFLPFKPPAAQLSLLILALGLPWATWAASKSSLQAEGLHCLWQSIGQNCPVSLLKQTQRTMGDERPRGRTGEGTTICWEGTQQALPALLIHSPYFREELAVSFEAVSCAACKVWFGIWVAAFPQVVVITHSLTFRLDTETKDVRKYTYFGEQFSTVCKIEGTHTYN